MEHRHIKVEAPDHDQLCLMQTSSLVGHAYFIVGLQPFSRQTPDIGLVGEEKMNEWEKRQK